MINLHNEVGNVAERLKDGMWQHPVLIMPNGMVYENLPHKGEGLSSIGEFLVKSNGEFRIKRFTLEQRRQHVSRVRKELTNPRGWSLLHNCQDTVTRITDGTPRSHQRDFWVGLAAIGLLAAIVSR